MNYPNKIIVETIATKLVNEFCCKYYDKDKYYNKIYTNITFLRWLIKDYGIKQVAYAGLEFLFILEDKKQIKQIHRESFGTPKNALEFLFGFVAEKDFSSDLATEALTRIQEVSDKNESYFMLLEKCATQKQANEIARWTRIKYKTNPQQSAKLFDILELVAGPYTKIIFLEKLLRDFQIPTAFNPRGDQKRKFKATYSNRISELIQKINNSKPSLF